jgi:fructokinase
MHPDNNKNGVVCFGEVLWDILPSGAVPGGAPVNVAYHLQQQGIQAPVITRIGADEQGKELLGLFAKKGVDTSWFQLDNRYETGKVYARPLSNHDVEYDIIQPVAWDHIAWETGFARLLGSASFFVYGTLAARNAVSRDTLFKLLELPCQKVFDINLRAGFYNRQLITELLGKADFVKMNLSELELVTAWYSNFSTPDDRLRFFSEKFGIKHAVVTMGARGAIFISDDHLIKQPGLTVTVNDTVGSGDAFLAGLLSKLITGVSNQEALEFANHLGAFVATKRGACPEYHVEDINAAIFKNTKTTI